MAQKEERQVRVVYEYVDNLTKPLKSSVDKAEGQTGRLKSLGDKAFSKIGDAAKYAAVGIAGLGVAAVGAGIAFGTRAVGEFRKFEQQLSDVSTLIKGDSTQAIDQLKTGIQDLLTTIPKDSEELGASAYAIFSAGITDTTKALETLEASGKLAVAGLGTTEQATTILTVALNAFKKEGLSAADTSDILFKTVKNGITTVDKMSESFGNVAGAAVSANIKFSDMQAATAALTAVTGKTSESQNALRQAYVELTVAGGKLDKGLQKNGFTIKDLQRYIGEEGSFVKGLEKMRKNTRLSDTEFKNLFSSVEAQGAVFALLTSANKTYNDTLTDMVKGTNSIDEAFNKQAQTGENLAQIAENRLTIAMQKLGEGLSPLANQFDILKAGFFSGMADEAGQITDAVMGDDGLVNAISSLLGISDTGEDGTKKSIEELGYEIGVNFTNFVAGAIGTLATFVGELNAVAAGIRTITGQGSAEDVKTSAEQEIKTRQDLLDRMSPNAVDRPRLEAEIASFKKQAGITGSRKTIRRASGGLVPPVYAASGMFEPRGTDTVPAMLTPGEAVMSKQAVENFAKGKAGNTIINIDLSGSVVSNDLIRKMVSEVERAMGRKNELNILGLS